jgi:hypothetical protein
MPENLEQWFLSKEALPIWQNALDGNYNERTITEPQPCSDLAVKRAEMSEMGVVYKLIPWK